MGIWFFPGVCMAIDYSLTLLWIWTKISTFILLEIWGCLATLFLSTQNTIIENWKLGQNLLLKLDANARKYEKSKYVLISEFEAYQSFCVDRLYYRGRFLGTAALICVTKLEVVCTQRPCVKYCCQQGGIICCLSSVINIKTISFYVQFLLYKTTNWNTKQGEVAGPMGCHVPQYQEEPLHDIQLYKVGYILIQVHVKKANCVTISNRTQGPPRSQPYLRKTSSSSLASMEASAQSAGRGRCCTCTNSTTSSSWSRGVRSARA